MRITGKLELDKEIDLAQRWLQQAQRAAHEEQDDLPTRNHTSSPQKASGEQRRKASERMETVRNAVSALATS